MLTSVQTNANHIEKKSKISRDRERDVGEQIALGQSKVPSSGEGITLFDQRLFDQVLHSAGFVRNPIFLPT